MDAGAGEPGQGDVADDHQLLGLGRLAGDAEPARPLALVHVAAAAERVVLAVLGERRPAAGARAYSIARRISRLSCTPVPSSVKSRTPSVGHLGHRRQLLAGPADGDGARRVRRRTAPWPRARAPRGRPPALVDGRRGVGHGDDRGEAAERGAPAAGLDRLGLLPARLAQVGVQVDQAGRDDAARRRRARVSPSRSAPDRDDAAVVDDARRRRARRSASTTRPPVMTSVIGPPPARSGSSVGQRRRRARGDGARLGRRAAGTAPPCARRRRCGPGR